MDSRFQEAWFNAPHRVLDRDLLTFSLERSVVLALIDSPFVSGDPDARCTLSELQFSVEVCSRDLGPIFGCRFNVTRWAKLKTLLWTSRCRLRYGSAEGLELECRKFIAYVNDYFSPPRLWTDKNGASTKLTAPWALSHAAFLIRNGFSERHAWTMPVGQAMWYCMAISEQTGASVEAMTDDEEKFLTGAGLV